MHCTKYAYRDSKYYNCSNELLTYMNVTMKKLLDISLFMQPSKLVLVMITLSIGVSRVFVPQREADVHRSGTWWCRERPHKGNVKAAVWVNVCVPFWYQPGKRNKQIVSPFTCAATRKWKPSSHVRKEWGDIWTEPSLSWRESGKSFRILLNARLFPKNMYRISIYYSQHLDWHFANEVSVLLCGVSLGQTELPSMNWKET